MDDKKKVINSLIRQTIFEALKQEDKIITKKDAKDSLHPNKKQGIVSKEKTKGNEELTRLAVGGFTQAFDAMERAMKELEPEDFKKFAIETLQHLKNAGVSDQVLKYFDTKLGTMGMANNFKDLF